MLIDSTNRHKIVIGVEETLFVWIEDNVKFLISTTPGPTVAVATTFASSEVPIKRKIQLLSRAYFQNHPR